LEIYHRGDLEASLSYIESMAMTRYLMYKYKLNNMEDKRLPKIASNLVVTTFDSSEDGIKMPSLG
jgi:hypothetical protein